MRLPTGTSAVYCGISESWVSSLSSSSLASSAGPSGSSPKKLTDAIRPSSEMPSSLPTRALSSSLVVTKRAPSSGCSGERKLAICSAIISRGRSTVQLRVAFSAAYSSVMASISPSDEGSIVMDGEAAPGSRSAKVLERTFSVQPTGIETYPNWW